MKRIRTEPHGYGAEGDERIRTAVTAPSDESVYEPLPAWVVGAIQMAHDWRYERPLDEIPQREARTMAYALCWIARQGGFA